MTLKVISQGHSPFSGLSKCSPSHIFAAFYQISTDSFTWPTVPKLVWLRSRDCLNFGQISVISRKQYKIGTYFQWKTNRKSYVAYRMAPVLVTLNDHEGHFPRSSPFAGLFKCNPSHIFAAFYQISTDSVKWPTVPKWSWLGSRAVSYTHLTLPTNREV